MSKHLLSRFPAPLPLFASFYFRNGHSSSALASPCSNYGLYPSKVSLSTSPVLRYHRQPQQPPQWQASRTNSTVGHSRPVLCCVVLCRFSGTHVVARAALLQANSGHTQCPTRSPLLSSPLLFSLSSFCCQTQPTYLPHPPPPVTPSECSVAFPTTTL